MPTVIAAPAATARRAFDLALDNDWNAFLLELVIPRDVFVALNRRFEPEADAEAAYAAMLDKLQQGFDAVRESAKTWVGIDDTDARVKNELEISKLDVAWETPGGARHTRVFTSIVIDDRRYVVDLG
jgi:hypothetical protein